MENPIGSVNINAKWIENIFENIKNLEMLERLAREGCESIIDYNQLILQGIDMNQHLANIKYKNLTMFYNELILLLNDIYLNLDETEWKKLRSLLDELKPYIGVEKLFLKKTFSRVKNRQTSIKTTPFYDQMIDSLSSLKLEILKSIKHLLYAELNFQP
jgi:Na+/phosphate symporter